MLNSNGRRIAGTALVCFGLLVYEILSSRLLGIVVSAHVVIYAIALAMLGMGAATSIMSLGVWPESHTEKNRSLSWIATILGLSYLLSLFLLTLISGYSNTALESTMDLGGLDALIDAIRSDMFYKMVWVGTILFIPYFIFGIFIAILFRSSPQSEYHKLYSADLIGAALGCILAVISLDYLGYAGCFGLILLSTFAGAVAFSDLRSKLATAINVALAVISVFIVSNSNAVSYFEPQPAMNQLARNYEKTYEVNQEWHAWNAQSRVALLSMRHKQSGVKKSVYAHQHGTGWAGVPDGTPFPSTGLVTMFNPKRVLVLFAGVGRDMVEIDRQCGGECEITGVEINRQMVDHALSEGFPELKEFTSRPGIEFHVAEAREYLERDTKSYDAILLSWWGAGASHYVGASGMLAQYLYTKEAFKSLLSHLTSDGILVVFNGSKAQALANFRQVFEEMNLGDLEDRVVVVRNKKNAAQSNGPGFYDLLEQMRLVVKPSGFGQGELNAVRTAAEAMGANIILSPEGVDPDYAVYQEIANGADLDAINRDLISNNSIELSMVTDNRPFFTWLVPRSYYFDIAKWIGSGADSTSWSWKIVMVFAYFMLFLGVVSVVLIIGPLLLKSGPELSTGNAARLFYFLALGSGFILVEVGLIRKLGLILGHPSYSISIVLAALIFSTGVGSLSSDRLFRSGILTVRRTASMIVAYIVLGAVLYEPLLYNAIVFPVAIKAVIVMIFLFPLGFLMGQLFPQGLVSAREEDSRLVPWAWAINGTASTISVGVGYLLSYPLGFDMLLYVGAAVYAGIIVLPLSEPRQQPVISAAKALT
jgi:hypothetical protein